MCPIYVYKCEKCDKEIELICKMNEKDKQKCPHCKSKLKSIVVSGGFKINGASFANGYTTQKK